MELAKPLKLNASLKYNINYVQMVFRFCCRKTAEKQKREKYCSL